MILFQTPADRLYIAVPFAGTPRAIHVIGVPALVRVTHGVTEPRERAKQWASAHSLPPPETAYIAPPDTEYTEITPDDLAAANEDARRLKRALQPRKRLPLYSTDQPVVISTTLPPVVLEWWLNSLADNGQSRAEFMRETLIEKYRESLHDNQKM